jgi:hypothetical protein
MPPESREDAADRERMHGDTAAAGDGYLIPERGNRAATGRKRNEI